MVTRPQAAGRKPNQGGACRAEARSAKAGDSFFTGFSPSDH